MFFKAIMKNLIICFMFVRTVQTVSMLYLPCIDLMVHPPTNSAPTVPTGCSLDGLFDLIEVVAGTVALAGTVKGIRFIFLYFLYFLHRFTFLYLFFSLHVSRS